MAGQGHKTLDARSDAPRCSARETREVAGHRIIEPQPPAFDELHGRGRGDDRGHREPQEMPAAVTVLTRKYLETILALDQERFAFQGSLQGGLCRIHAYGDQVGERVPDRRHAPLALELSEPV